MELSVSYMKRTQFEAQQIALQVGKLFGGVSEQVHKASGHTTNRDPLKPGRTSASALLGSLGFNPAAGLNKTKYRLKH
jgi:hypothetical protein